MAHTITDFVDGLRSAMAGTVLTPGDTGYAEARKVWNADIDRHPAVIAQCLNAADVSAAVRFAVDHDLELAVRGGAHSVSGASVVDDGVMVDLRQMNHVDVDPHARRVRVGGGALLSDMDAATQAHGLAVPAGLISHTGVGGLTLGGGMGWLTRQFGLSIDNMVSAEVVTADGRILRASDDDNPDLFWAIRGGGGNFGVVTEFEFIAHPVGPVVQVGLVFWTLEQGREVLRLARDLIADLPPELNVVIAGLNAPPAPFVPEEHHLQPGYALVVVGFGSSDVHDAALERIRTALPPLWEFISPMPYVALQQMMDDATQWGLHNYEKSAYLEELSDEVIDVVIEHLPQKTSPLSLLLFYRLDGAYSNVPDDATAFGGARSPRYAVFIVATCPSPELLEADRPWTRAFWEAVRPFTPDIGCYLNALADADQQRIEAAYGPEKYARLANIKGKFDPQNRFRRNANIKPA